MPERPSDKSAEHVPPWVQSILEWRGTWLLARIALTSAYVIGGLTKLTNFPAAVAEMEHFGLHPGAPWAILTLTVELVGSAMIISGRMAWLGAGALGVFTGIANLLVNHFWTMQGQERFMASNAFWEHIGLIAAFVMAALIAARAPHPRAGAGCANGLQTVNYSSS
jgi:uncharacterized membrane protein YphA (DoxX/SURF4 family)